MIGKDIFSNLQNDKEYQEWFQQIMTEGRNYESPFGVNPYVSGTPSAQDISNSYMMTKQRRPFVIEYYENSTDSKPKSITMYINPERLTISNNKIIGKQITRGGIFYHHYGADHSIMSLTGSTGLSGMAGIKQLEEIYYASGTLLRYKNYTPTQIYGSVSNFNVIDYTNPISVIDKVRTANYSNDMITDIQQKMYDQNKDSLDKNTLYNCIEILEIYKNNENLNRLVNNTLKKISNDMLAWEAAGNLDYRGLNQKIIDSLRKDFPTLSDKIITGISHELSIAKKYEDEPLLDKTRSLNDETNINTLPRTLQFKTMRNNALMEHIKNIKDFENRDKQIRDLLRSGLINLTEDMKDEWLPRQLIIYFENRAYVGHFESFTYNRDSKTNLINYEMKYVITKQYEFNNLNEPFSDLLKNNNNNSGGIVVNPVNPPSTNSNTSKPNGNLYIVKAGDNLESISKQFYGTIDYWSDIYAANVNTIDDPDWIYPGMQLTIPEYSKTIRHWVVQEGDSLWSIAARFYSDSNQWKRIYDVNPHIKNPNYIYPGDVLKILL